MIRSRILELQQSQKGVTGKRMKRCLFKIHQDSLFRSKVVVFFDFSRRPFGDPKGRGQPQRPLQT